MSVWSCVALLALPIATSGLAADYQAAKDLYDQGDVAKAKQEFSAVLATAGSLPRTAPPPREASRGSTG